LRITQDAAQLFIDATSSATSDKVPEPIFLGGHPMAGKELSGIAAADADLFRDHTYALISDGDGKTPRAVSDLRVAAFVKILEKLGARPLWIGAQQHDYAVALASHLPQLAAVALGSFLYDRLDENGLPITLAGPGLRDSLRLAGSSYSTWRDIVLTNKELLSASLDLFARRLDDLRERLGSRELEADFDAANELYKLLRSL
jgi:prephenate dehydrogenase